MEINGLGNAGVSGVQTVRLAKSNIMFRSGYQSGGSAAEAAYPRNEISSEVQGEDQKNEDAVIIDMLDELNDVMDEADINLEFKHSYEYNGDIENFIVKIISKKTGEVIKEYPSEEFVNNMVKMEKWIGALLDNLA